MSFQRNVGGRGGILLSVVIDRFERPSLLSNKGTISSLLHTHVLFSMYIDVSFKSCTYLLLGPTW
jgi:hypothetical protein